MTQIFYAVKIEDIVSREYWEIVPAKSKVEAVREAAELWTKYGGRVSRIRRATDVEIERYRNMQTMTREEFFEYEGY